MMRIQYKMLLHLNKLRFILLHRHRILLNLIGWSEHIRLQLAALGESMRVVERPLCRRQVGGNKLQLITANRTQCPRISKLVTVSCKHDIFIYENSSITYRSEFSLLTKPRHVFFNQSICCKPRIA